ncbi:aldehyde dehydrogenase family protein [Marinobacterium maritimum]|uniref:Aldehyde dehydrogenase family protein n=1 Tax=Marinobacterium maritimum TaxID=500162 RepID=A0ABN1IA63_9GAMM
MTHYKQLYIAGRWVDSASTAEYPVINPATEQPITSVAECNLDDVNLAVAAAKTALPAWATTPGRERARYISAIAERLKQRETELAELISRELGMPAHLALEIQVRGPIAGLESYIQYAHQLDETEQIGNSLIVTEPVGVCALISPWNYPLHQLIGKVGPALAAGCTMVVKPSVEAPLSAYLLAQICADAGLPAGVFNLISGSGHLVGEALCTHHDVDMISFTGSTQTGIKVAQSAANSVKRVCQELGGKSPLIITPEADLEAAVQYGVEDIMINSGQTCTALSRMLVPSSRYEEAVSHARQVAEQIKVGSPQEAASFMGPLVSRQQQQVVQRYIQQGINEGARLIAGGLGKPAGIEAGYYVKPTIFADVHPNMTIAREEIFGPVLCMIPYQDLDDAVRIANDSVFGLSAAVWADSEQQALEVARRLQSGQVFINGGAFNYQAPFGGYKQSGNGREWGLDSLREFTETKAIQLPRG